MRITVLNGSPKVERSDCMCLTSAFLKGMGETAAVVDIYRSDIKPCLGCFACWGPAGKCVQQDDVAGILEQVVASDLVIFSMPLYTYGMTSQTKAFVDRMLSLSSSKQIAADDGSTHHPTKRENKTRFLLISGCGFPNLSHNYEGLLFQFGMCFGKDFPRILCAESPLLHVEQAKPVAEKYLALCEKAGAEFKANGAISSDTQKALDEPMYPPELYRSEINA